MNRKTILFGKELLKSVCFLFISVLLFIACNGDKDLPAGANPSDAYVDYANKQNWFKLDSLQKFGVDVFYLYPTAWLPGIGEGLYCNIDNQSMRVMVPNVYSEQAALFEDFANVYVPWYRQANAYMLLQYPYKDQKKFIKAYPYKDALAAFEYYLKEFNHGRPFILAAHAQGSFVMKCILEDYMSKHPEVLSNMVAAYLLGWSFESSYFEKNPHLSFATKADDTQVVISWNTERQDNGRFASYNRVCKEGALSINPISWEHNYAYIAASDERNLGKWPSGEKYAVQVLFDPMRKYEVLIVDVDNTLLDMPSVGEFSLHGADYKLFYKNIQTNAKERIKAFWANQKK